MSPLGKSLLHLFLVHLTADAALVSKLNKSLISLPEDLDLGLTGFLIVHDL
jgi:hypothetical protein